MTRVYNIIGQTFGRLRVIDEAPGKGAMYRCVCECGNEKIAASQNIRSGLTRSCGCLVRELGKAKRTEAFSAPVEHATWARIIRRCENRNCSDYPEYGGRGIRIAPEWRHDFGAFLRHIGMRPSKSHSVDRIDVNGNYEPGNVRWATPAQQARNTRRNRRIDVDGETRLLTDWARASGNSESTIFYRLKRGWVPRRAVFTPTTRTTRGT